MNIMESSENDIVLLDSDDKVKKNEVVLVDSDDEMNLVITDVISLAGEGQESKNGATSKESDPVEAACSVKKGVGHAENARSSRESISSQKPPPLVVPKVASSIVANKASVISRPICDTSVPPAVDMKPAKILEPIPNIDKCFVGWKNIFPWVEYHEYNNTFTCSICKWGYNFPDYYEVYTLMNSNHIFFVAAKLRAHSKMKHHNIALKEQQLILKLYEGIYPLLKCEILKISSFADILNKVSDHLSKDIPEKKTVALVMIQNLTVAVERKHLESLIQSPFFSVIAFGKMDSLIVRWLTQDDEVVEHLFCSHLLTSNEKLHILAYLQYCGVDMDRMVSYSDLLQPLTEVIISSVKVVNVANRCCPIDTCIEWLRKADALQDLFMHIQALPKLCRMAANKLKWHYKAKDIANIKDSEAFKLILDNRVLDFIFNNAVLLDEVSKEVSDLENSDKLNFKRLSTLRRKPVIVTLYLLHKLDTILQYYDSPHTLSSLKGLRTFISDNISQAVNASEHFVMSIIDMFTSHNIMSKTSQINENSSYVDILVMSMSNIDFHDLEKVFSKFMPKLQGGKGFHQLQQLLSIFGKDKRNSPLKLIASLQSQPEYHSKYPELLKLGQMIMVLPTLNANQERYSFDVAVAEAYIAGKVEESLVPYLQYILLEGPDNTKSLNTESFLTIWSKTDPVKY